MASASIGDAFAGASRNARGKIECQAWPQVHRMGYRQVRDCYEKCIDVQFVDRLREERKFSGPEELKAALISDKSKTIDILSKTSPPQF